MIDDKWHVGGFGRAHQGSVQPTTCWRQGPTRRSATSSSRCRTCTVSGVDINDKHIEGSAQMLRRIIRFGDGSDISHNTTRARARWWKESPLTG